jgi:hypothetical protein
MKSNLFAYHNYNNGTYIISVALEYPIVRMHGDYNSIYVIDDKFAQEVIEDFINSVYDISSLEPKINSLDTYTIIDKILWHSKNNCKDILYKLLISDIKEVRDLARKYL